MAVFGGGEEPGKPIARFGRFAVFARTGGQELRRAVLPQQNGRAEQTGRPAEASWPHRGLPINVRQGQGDEG